jgi:glycine oxidase
VESRFYNESVKTWDVIVIGGGIIGLSLAIELHKRGAAVLIVERGEAGREASHAAGGMLVDCPLETAPALQELATASARMYPEFVHELEVESGVKVDLSDHGTIIFPSADHLPQAETLLRPASAAELEPGLNSILQGRRAFYLAERCVDPRALCAAAVQTAKRRGVDFSSGDEVIRVNVSGGCASGVTTTKTALHAAKVVNCAGAWAGKIGPHAFPTRPVKGQMLYLVMPSRDLLKHVIRAPEAYLIPRSDGRVLVGTTVEEAGFDKRTDAATIQRLHRAAINLVPKLADARILEDWAGLRPGTPDALPILGETPTRGYYAATGHYRDGILLAPITAEIVSKAIEGNDCGYDLTAFLPMRFPL